MTTSHDFRFGPMAAAFSMLLTLGCSEDKPANTPASSSETVSSESSESTEQAPEETEEGPSAETREATQEAPSTAEPATLAIGAAAPSQNVEMRNVDDSAVTIGGIRGERGTLVIFSCNHCPWVQAWETRIVELGNTYRTRGIGVIAINANDPAEYPDDGFEPMQARARERAMAFPYVVDATSNVARSFGATRTPEAFLFDSDMNLVYHGAIDDNAHEPDAIQHYYLKDALDSLLAGRPIEPNDTRFLGCSIKFRDAT